MLKSRVDRKSTRLNSSHQIISYAVFCLKKKGKYRELLVQKYPKRYGSIAQHFDNFLRNAIPHAQYIIRENGDIETWNMIKGFFLKKRPPRNSPLFPTTALFM